MNRSTAAVSLKSRFAGCFGGCVVSIRRSLWCACLIRAISAFAFALASALNRPRSSCTVRAVFVGWAWTAALPSQPATIKAARVIHERMAILLEETACYDED